MDKKAKQRSLYREKLNASNSAKKDNRIDSPLVRYNEHDQPVCKLCDVIVKPSWTVHQAQRKHREAVNNYKANAGAVSLGSNVKAVPAKEIPKSKPGLAETSTINKLESSTGLPKSRPSSSLPSDFFDNKESKKQKKDADSSSTGGPVPLKNPLVSAQAQAEEPFIFRNEINGLSTSRNIETKTSEIQPSKDISKISQVSIGSEAKQVKGALPEGFFDNKDADLRARGITPVKPDVKDEYKEFEKLIKEDLQEVDNRFEEEEIDAAEMIEESETVEQRTYRERVERLRKKKMELEAARTARQSKSTQVTAEESNKEESSSDDDDDDDDSDENLTVDWRAKHL